MINKEVINFLSWLVPLISQATAILVSYDCLFSASRFDGQTMLSSEIETSVHFLKKREMRGLQKVLTQDTKKIKYESVVLHV